MSDTRVHQLRRVVTAEAVDEAGAPVLGASRRTPFESTNARLDASAGLQLTLFEMDTI